MKHADVVIVGGGAAGLMCAARASQRGRSVRVLERANQVGRKILMSGGGRCNFTNRDVTPAHYLSANPHFCKSALSRYTQWDFIGLVNQHGIPYHERRHGQLFCDDSARDILNLLLAECEQGGATISTGCDIQAVEHNGHFCLHTNQGCVEAEVLVVATGGLSIPSMGVTGFGYELARQFGLGRVPTRPGLVPFTFTDSTGDLMHGLSGIAVDVVLHNVRNRFHENILFTHRGLSGPAALQLSSYWREGETVTLDLLPGVDAVTWLLEAKKTSGRSLLRNLLAERLPRKLVLALEAAWWAETAEKPLADCSHRHLEAIAEKLQHWELKPAGTEGYRTAEVTLGGVDTDCLSSKTLESKTCPGLFFIGEVVDVAGWLGGYNFQWSWSSAVAAALAV